MADNDTRTTRQLADVVVHHERGQGLTVLLSLEAKRSGKLFTIQVKPSQIFI